MQIHVVDHPLIKEKMTRLRDKNCLLYTSDAADD